MIRLQNGGAVREVETQREADYYAGFGYKVIASDEQEHDAQDGTDGGAAEGGSGDDDKKPGGSGKKGAAKEE